MVLPGVAVGIAFFTAEKSARRACSRARPLLGSVAVIAACWASSSVVILGMSVAASQAVTSAIKKNCDELCGCLLMAGKL